MSKTLGWLSWLVTVRPYITLIVLLIITVLLAGGLRAAPRRRRGPMWRSFRPGIPSPMRRVK